MRWKCKTLGLSVFLCLQGVALIAQNVVENPSANQAIVQPAGTVLSANNLADIRYVTLSWNWSCTDGAGVCAPGSLGSLTTAGPNTIKLTCTTSFPCPLGIDTTDGAYPLSNNFSITGGTAILTSAANPFNGIFVGEPICVPGAGPSGATLCTLIQSYQNAGQVTLLTNATTTASGGGTNYLMLSSYVYAVYLSGAGTPEAAPVVTGSCTPGATSGNCTLNILTVNSHASGYTVSSSTSGIQEAWNDAWVNDSGSGGGAGVSVAPYVKCAADTTYSIYSSLYTRGRGGILDCAGGLIQSNTRDRTIYVGTTQGHPYVNEHKLYNLTGTSTVNVDGVQVSSVCAGTGCSPTQPTNTYLVTTVSTHHFLAANTLGASTALPDTVDCEYYSQNAVQHWTAVVTSVPSSTSFTVTFGTGTNFAISSNTFGWCNLLNTFVENNSDHVIAQDININQITGTGPGYFSWGITNDNDQHFIIERATNRSSVVINNTANWPNGAFFYQRYDQGLAGIAYLHSAEITGLNCASSAGNGFVFTDSVCQGFPVFGFRYFGGLQPSTIQNMYQESTGSSNNPSFGIPAQMGMLFQGSANHKILGTFPLSGFAPTFANQGGATVTKNYFVVPRNGSAYGPVLYIGQALTVGVTGGAAVPLKWPAVSYQDVTGAAVSSPQWDIFYTTGSNIPVSANATQVTTALSAGTACTSAGVCSFSDPETSVTGYAIQSQTYGPSFWFWPTSLVFNNTVAYLEKAATNPSAVSSQGILAVSIIAEQCISAGPAAQRSPLWVSCPNSDSGGGSGSMAWVLQEQDTANNGPAVNSKGRINLGKLVGAPNDLLTLQDSNFNKTMSTAGHRPSNDANDMAIGVDQSGGFAQRAQNSITNYIGAVPNGGATNFAERLTNSLKTFTVPVQATAYQTSTNCSAAGTAANPSVASCSAAAAGAFSCDPAASGGTCKVNTTSVTANSDIQITSTASAGTRLGVTCNTSADTTTKPRIASIGTGASFTINLGSFSTNPECFLYNITN